MKANACGVLLAMFAKFTVPKGFILKQMFSWIATLVLGITLYARTISSEYTHHGCLVAAACHAALLFDNLLYFDIQQAVLNTIYIISYVAVVRLYWDSLLKKAV